MPTQRFSLAKSLRHERRHRALICLVLVWAGVWVTPATFDDHHSCSSGQSTRKGDSIIGHFSGGFSKKISSKDYLSLCHFQFQNLVKTFCICFYFVCLSLILLHPVAELRCSLQTKTQFFLGWKSQPEICTISDSWLLIYITEKQKQWQYHWHARILSKKRNNIVFLMAAIS